VTINKPDSRDTLETVAGKINAYLKKSDDQRVSAALLLREAKERIESGEAGDISWVSWCTTNIKRYDGKPKSLRDIERLIAAAYATDPYAHIDADREKSRLSMAKSRAKKNAEAKLDRAIAAVTALDSQDAVLFYRWYTQWRSGMKDAA
jgi:hypothetical protein